MDLFEEIGRIYGVSVPEMEKTVVEPWKRPCAAAVSEFLLSYYPGEACRLWGFQHYPYARIAAACPIRPPSRALPRATSMEAARTKAVSLTPEQLASYLFPLRDASLWDGETYRMTAFDPVEPKATFSIDRFLQFRLTTGLMREELHFALSKGCTALPLREQIAPDPSTLFDWPHRLVCGGVHTLCAFARPSPFDDFVIPLQRRSSKVGVAGGSYGVIPMAFHQPSNSGTLDPREPATTALREVFEELFCGVESHQEALFLTHPAIEWLLQHQTDVHFETTNFFVSLFGGNYDFSLLLAVTNTDFWQSFGPSLRMSWESGEHFLLSSLDKTGLRRILNEPEWEAQALGCSLDGLRRLQSIEPARTWSEPYDPAAS